MKILKLLYIVIIGLAVGCNMPTTTNGVTGYDETPTRGEINIAVDQSYSLIMDTQIYTFTSLYQYAKINPRYVTEIEALHLFMNDSVRFMITSRPLTQKELDVLVSRQVVARTTKLAFDAMALIVNNENADSLITYNNVQNILTGKISDWKEINPKSKNGKIEVVYDNVESGNARLVREKFGLQKMPANCYAAKTNDEVINYIEKNKNAIGVISVNWVSDRDDSLSLSFLKRVKVVGISATIDPDGKNGDYFRPYQAYIANAQYPFIRDVYAINRESFAGLGTGFINFMAADNGQRIILKSGLVPATMPIRLIQVKKQ